MNDPWPVLAAGFSSVTALLLIRWVAPPRLRLAVRVRPYGSGRIPMRYSGMELPVGSALFRLLQMALAPIVRRMVVVLDRDGGARTALRLRQAGIYQNVDGDQAVGLYRASQLKSGLGFVGGAIGLAMSLELPAGRALGLCLLAGIIGVTRHRGAIDRAIRRRRELMRIEIYTVNQLLAMRIRAGGGIVHAVQQIVSRGRGEVVSELTEAMRLHRAGMRVGEAFHHLATVTPEPACARTYALLGAAEERGADLAGALLELSEDVREARREAMRRAATRRRAAMLVPIIGILAPVMLLFVGAPLPRIIFSWQ